MLKNNKAEKLFGIEIQEGTGLFMEKDNESFQIYSWAVDLLSIDKNELMEIYKISKEELLLTNKIKKEISKNYPFSFETLKGTKFVFKFHDGKIIKQIFEVADKLNFRRGSKQFLSSIVYNCFTSINNLHEDGMKCDFYGDSTSTIERHLKILKQSNIVKCKKLSKQEYVLRFNTGVLNFDFTVVPRFFKSILFTEELLPLTANSLIS